MPNRLLDLLMYRQVQAVSLWSSGVLINVPAPERFAMHNLLVSRLLIETSQSQAKAITDICKAGERITIFGA